MLNSKLIAYYPSTYNDTQKIEATSLEVASQLIYLLGLALIYTNRLIWKIL